MKLPTSILVPTDFSETADKALDYAVLLAAKLDARIHLLHVIAIPDLGVPELGVAITSTLIDRYVHDGQVALDRRIDTRRTHASFGEPLLRTGEVRGMILQAAKDVRADLVVVGTHGRRGLAHALIGSVAEAIVRMAHCPVLTVSGKAVTP